MIRFIFSFTGAVLLILLAAWVAAWLARVRTEGISVRLQVFVALGFIVGAFAFGLGLLVLDRIEARATLLATEAARDEAAAIAAFIAGEIDASGADMDQIARTLENQRRRKAAARSQVTLLDTQGRQLFAEGPTGDEPGTVKVVAPVETEKKGVVGHVQVVKPTIIMRRLLEDFAPTVLLISAALGVAAALAAALIGRAIAHPIEKLTAFAERVSEGERSAQPPAAHGLEVMRLSRAIDKMRRELEGRPYVESFAADLSHELKNPVAAIRAAAEVLDDGALAEPEEAQRFVKRIREATGRIEVMLAELLSLARIESRGVENQETIDLAALVRSCAEHWGADVAIRVEGPSLHVRGDRRWLARALDNLIDNALAHGDKTRKPEVVLRASGDDALIAVVSGGRIVPHMKKRLFRRFATSRADKGGTGLGLAIVRAVAEAHGGRVDVQEREEPAEVEFQMKLPRAEALARLLARESRPGTTDV